MSTVLRNSGSSTSRRHQFPRIVALVATFLLVMAGMVVSPPGVMTASATGSGSPTGDSNGGHDGDDHECESDDDSGGHDGKDDSGKDDSGKDDSGKDDSGKDHAASIETASLDTSGGGDGAPPDDGKHDDDGKPDDDSSGGHDGSHDGDGKDDCKPGEDGDHDDDDDCSQDDGTDDGKHDGGDDCKPDDDDDDCSHDDDDDCTSSPPLPPPPATTATLTLNKIVMNDSGGAAVMSDFTLAASPSAGADVIHGADTNVDPAVGISADVPAPASYVLSETGPAGYDASGWTCSAGTLVGATLTLAVGDVANCTITNDDQVTTANLTVVKAVTYNWGGTVPALSFELTVDGTAVTQGVAMAVIPGVHTISEAVTPGYTQTGIACIDVAGVSVPVDSTGSINLAAGQDVTCTVSNADLPAVLTLTKVVINDNGGVVPPEGFQLMIDGIAVPQGVPINLASGHHVISEPAANGYRLVDIVCTQGATPVPVTTGGIDLALDQHVSCIVTNNDAPVDLVITKTDDDFTKVAGGPAFNYTITVDNMGPRDATVGKAVTVTDQLPVGLAYVLPLPANCTAAGQTLTCSIDPLLLHLADLPVPIVVTVRALPDAPSGIYTNLVYVDTDDDKAPIVPACGASNNVACQATDITRQASLSVTKTADVASTTPGADINYTIVASNGGPSTFLLTIDDPLPAGLTLLGVTADSSWTCNNTNPVHCTYTLPVQPNTSAPPVIIHVRVANGYAGPPIHNVVTASAVVEIPTGSAGAPPPGGPGTTVTATDDELTPVVGQVAAVASDAPVPGAGVSSGAGVGSGGGLGAAGGALPSTGISSIIDPITLAGVLMVLGLISVTISRRRRSPTA